MYWLNATSSLTGLAVIAFSNQGRTDFHLHSKVITNPAATSARTDQLCRIHATTQHAARQHAARQRIGREGHRTARKCQTPDIIVCRLSMARRKTQE